MEYDEFVIGDTMEYKMPLVYELQSYPGSHSLDNIYQTPLKAKNLDIYLANLKKQSPRAIMVGGTPVFAGSRRTGIPFTDEYHIGSEEVTILQSADPSGYTIRNREYLNEHEPAREQGAGVIWQNLLDCMDSIVLWNIFPFYPHEEKAYSITRPLTNKEMEDGLYFLLELLKEFYTVDKIIVASELAAQIISRNEQLKNRYDIFYVSNPAITGTNEFINRVRMSLLYKEEILEQHENTVNDGVSYEYRRRWADTNLKGEYYCRALNKIMPEENAYFCEYCPCNLKQPLYCGYYDFNRTDHNTPLELVKKRFDMLIDANLIPLFPDYMKRNFSNRGLVIEKALQFAATYYRDRIQIRSKMPYMMYLLNHLHLMTPYVMSMKSEEKEDILVAVILQTILKDSNVTKQRLSQKFGDYVLSLIDTEHEEHDENVKKVIYELDDMGAPESIIEYIMKTTQVTDV